MRPPVPPPVPPAVPPTTAEHWPAAMPGDGLPVVRHRPRARRTSGGGLIVAIGMLLASATLVVAALVAWPQPRRRSDPTPAAREPIATQDAATPAPAPSKRPAPPPPPPVAEDRRPASPAVAVSGSGRGAERREESRPTSREPPAAEAATDLAPPEPSRREAEATVDRQLKMTLAALRAGDLPAARRAADAADTAVGDDPDVRSRVDRWLLLLNYAGKLEAFRRQAAESAAKGREYEVEGRTIAIVELTPERFAYKDAGRIERGARGELPLPIERAILETWFAGDGRAANHIFLGIARLLEPRADLAAVRSEWETALGGEPATKPLMPLLDDPLILGLAGQ